MGMLKSISLENYKCFKKLDNFKISPLTVLTGVNSSGKSSILKSLLILKQSYESNSTFNSLALNGKYTNNGFFDDIANNPLLPVKIKNVFSIQKSSYMTTQEKLALRDLQDIYNSKNEFTHFDISIEISMRSQKRKNLAYGDNIIDRILIDIVPYNRYIKNYLKTQIRFNLIEDLEYNIIISGLPSIKSDKLELLGTTCHFDGLKIVNLYFTEIKPNQNVDAVLSNIFSISRIISLQYKDINYISPLRSAPERRYIIEQDIENVGIYGEFIAQALEKFKTDTAKINSLPAEDCFSSSYSPIKSKVPESVNSWLQYLGIEKYGIENNEEILRLSIGNYNILDVGFGVSQALPIITACNILQYKSTLLLEQPEVHLHPKMQMNMADLLIATSMAHKNVIVETHSDHIINRISRRMMQTEYILKNSKIVFVDKDLNTGSYIEDIEVDPVRGIITDNENFFREFSSETEKILITGYKNKVR